MIDEGEEITPGVPLFTVTTTKDQEVVISLSSDEKDQVSEWSLVEVFLWDQWFAWRIVSISDIWDDQLLYKTTVIMNQLVDRLGEIVRVEIPLSSEYPLVPLQHVTMQTTSQWLIYVRNWASVEKVQVELWDVWESSIEVLTRISPTSKIITSSMVNFDPNVHKVQMKWFEDDDDNKKELEKNSAEEVEIIDGDMG